MKILITWATWKLWQSVLKNLEWKISKNDVYCLVRDESKKELCEKYWFNAVVWNYLDLNSLEKAFDWIDLLYFISSSDLENRFLQHKNVVDAAKNAGVKHIIYTSFDRIDSEKSALGFINDDHKNTEDYIKDSGLNYTILLHGIYLENIPDFIWDVSKTKTIFFPAWDAKVAFTSREDLAIATSNLLLNIDISKNNIYKFISSNSYNFYDISEELTKIYWEKITYIDANRDDYSQKLNDFWVPEIYINMWILFWTAMKNWEFVDTDNTLEKFLWKKSETIIDYLNKVYKI